MSKRSTRVAKRGEFEDGLKAIEEGLRSRRGKSTAAITPEAPGETVEPAEGESADVDGATSNVSRSEERPKSVSVAHEHASRG